MLPTNVMSFMKKMVATEEVVSGAGAGGQTEAAGTLGKLRQTLSSSLLTAQDKVTKLSPRPVGPAESALELAVTLHPAAPPAPSPAPAPAQPSAKNDREAGKPPSRVGACRVCLKALKPDELYHTCQECQHRVCEDCSSYSKPTGYDDTIAWRCSVCRRKAAPRRPPATQDSTDSLLDVPMLDTLQRRHSEARLGSSNAASGLAPPRSPELRRHSDVSPASLKELEKGGTKSGGESESRRASGSLAHAGGGVSPARRRSVRAPHPRQRSCDEEAKLKTELTKSNNALNTVPSMPRRASAYDVIASGGAVGGGGGSRRSSYRCEDPAADMTPQIAGLSVDEDRPIRRRGSQLPDIAALQQRTGVLSAQVRSSESNDSAAMAAAVAARQMSVDAEAIKIVIHDVDDSVPRRVVLRRDPNDKGSRSRGFGMRVVGGKPDSSGRREAVIVWTVPGGPADLAGLQQGDKVVEWCGEPLSGRSFEEVCAVLERSGSTVELLVTPAAPLDEHQPLAQTPHQHLYEPETDKSPSSPTRRKLPKTPV